MNRRHHIGLTLAVLSAVAADADPAAITKQCRADVSQMNAALIRGDFAKVADLTLPKIVADNGGREKTIAAMAEASKRMTARGVALQSATVDAPSDPVSAGGKVYVVVPYTLAMRVPKGVMRQRAFVIGVSPDNGQSWRYASGDVSKAALPDLPASLKLPEKQKPVVTKT